MIIEEVVIKSKNELAELALSNCLFRNNYHFIIVIPHMNVSEEISNIILTRYNSIYWLDKFLPELTYRSEMKFGFDNHSSINFMKSACSFRGFRLNGAAVYNKASYDEKKQLISILYPALKNKSQFVYYE